MVYIDCKNVTLSYEGREVVSGLTFQIEKGDYLCIVGENGSGKSTLVKGILGFVKAHSGQIEYGEGVCRNEIGYLPQQSGRQRDFPASVREVVISGCLNHMGMRPFYSAREKKKARYNMEKLGIYDLAARSYGELSGGQQQRVLLARAVCGGESSHSR